MTRTPMNADVLSPNAIQWLFDGERGTSSDTLFAVLSGLPLLEEEDMSYPLDAHDFRRCCLLLDACPEIAARLPGMRDVSPEWDALVPAWYALFTEMSQENPLWRERPGTLERTDRRIHEILRHVANGDIPVSLPVPG